MSEAMAEDLTEVYGRLWLPMVRLARLLVGSDLVAEDLAQEAFLALGDRLEAVDNPDGYLRTSIVNRSRSWHRRQATERRHRQRPVRPVPVTGEPELDETWHLVQRLPERQRTAVVLRFYEDLSEAQIAEVLGCRPGTVKSSLHRALARLREELT